MVEYYVNLGFDGFRCDAAYKVPAELWAQLIGAARRKNPDACFVAETLGCRLSEVTGLATAGFDYLFNAIYIRLGRFDLDFPIVFAHADDLQIRKRVLLAFQCPVDVGHFRVFGEHDL